eukprot:1045466-Pleurochrysis_carterae.AAC.1
MNLAERGQGAACVRRIGKSSDPDHPFHPCDDVDSDDAAIEALLDSSSSHTQSSTRTRSPELDYDPAYPYLDPHTRVSPSAARRATASQPPDNAGKCITITLPRPEMDALMRARDIAAQRARVDAANHHAQACTPSAAFVDCSDAQATPHPEPVASREQRSPPPDASPAVDRPLEPSCAQPDSYVPREHQPAHHPRRLSTCAMLSILLNVIAFSTAIALGTRQLWDNGALRPVPYFSLATLASLPALMLLALLRRSPPRPRMPSLRTQATDGQHTPARPSLRAGPTPRALLALALVLTSTASGTASHAAGHHPRPPARSLQ